LFNEFFSFYALADSGTLPRFGRVIEIFLFKEFSLDVLGCRLVGYQGAAKQNLVKIA
jgi:hypothetical protein